MCLHVSKTQRAKKAKEDITCYKVMLKGDQPDIPISFWRLHPWKLGNLSRCHHIEKTIVFEPDLQYAITGALHSFVDKDGALVELKSLYESLLGNPDLRHPISNDVIDVENIILTRCTIPKGTRYFKGSDNGSEVEGYASEGLMVEELETIDPNLLAEVKV